MKPVHTAAAACLFTIMLCGCAKPIVVGPFYLGIGLFEDHQDVIEGGATHVRVEGFGVLFALRHISIGYCRRESVVCEAGANVDIRGEMFHLATGTCAERIAVEFTGSWQDQEGATQ